MSEVTVLPTSQAPTAAPKLNAIQVIEQHIVEFTKQREQAIANVHAIDGAVQGFHRLLATLKAEVAKAEGVSPVSPTAE